MPKKDKPDTADIHMLTIKTISDIVN